MIIVGTSIKSISVRVMIVLPYIINFTNKDKLIIIINYNTKWVHRRACRWSSMY